MNKNNIINYNYNYNYNYNSLLSIKFCSPLIFFIFFFLVILFNPLTASSFEPKSNPNFKATLSETENISNINTYSNFELYKNVRNSVAILFADGNICTAFLIKTNTLITAAHCMKYFHFSEIAFYENQNLFYPVKVTAINKEADLAILKIITPTAETSNKIPLKIVSNKIFFSDEPLDFKETSKATDLAYTTASSSSPTSPASPVSPSSPVSINPANPPENFIYEGQDVFAIGHPGYGSQSLKDKRKFKHDDTFYFAKGIVSKVGEQYIATDIRVRPGNSGGPLFNSKSEVIGLVSGLYNDYAMTVPYTKINNFINQFSEEKTPLDWSQSEFNADFIFWYSSHTYLKRLDRVPDFFYSQLDLNFYDRISINLITNFSEGLRFSGLGIGFRWPVIFDHNLSYFTTGIESVAYNLNPKESDKDLTDIRSARGAYVQFLPGHSGLAIKIEALQIKSEWESILGIGVFF